MHDKVNNWTAQHLDVLLTSHDSNAQCGDKHLELAYVWSFVAILLTVLILPLQTFEARLGGLHRDRRESWQEMCNTTPARIHGLYFSRPTRCIQDKVDLCSCHPKLSTDALLSFSGRHER